MDEKLLSEIIENQQYHTKLLESIFNTLDARDASLREKRKLMTDNVNHLLGFIETLPGVKMNPGAAGLLKKMMESIRDVN